MFQGGRRVDDVVKTASPSVVDLFSGCGGMSWGLHLDGFEVVAAVDEWDRALQTFKANHPSAAIFAGDIRELTTSEVLAAAGIEQGELDVLVGGPPCQGFSKNVRASQRFLDDPRNQLFRDYLRFVRELQPRVVVMENVAELYNAYEGSVREEILSTLEELGYAAEARVLYAPDYGVPQRRRRCFIIAANTGREPKFPDPTHGPTAYTHLLGEVQAYVTAWEAISDLPPLAPGETNGKHATEPRNVYQAWVRNGAADTCNHFAPVLKPTQQARYEALEPGQGMKDLPAELRPKSGYSGAYGRLDFDCLAPTITRWVFHSGSGRYGHPVQRRIISMREAARLQSFTDDFVFTGTRNDVAGQIGNAVPPRLMLVLASEIRRLLDV